MSVNVSMRQLESDGFVDDVRAVLDAHGLAPSPSSSRSPNPCS